MKTLIFVFCSITLYACATSPSGRRQLLLLPDRQMTGMGEQAFAQMKNARPIEANQSVVNYVKCIAIPISQEAHYPGVKDWEIVVFKDPTANAFALPGGKIGVHTGILAVAKTPSQLAAVLGHEVGHVIAKHGNERVSQAMAAQGGLLAIGALNSDNPNQGPIMAALGLGAQFGILLPHGRKQESEADIIGLDLMAKAGFDPREAIELWKNMGTVGGKQPPEFISTHPSHETRIEGLKSEMPKAMIAYQQSKTQGKNPQCYQ